MMLNRYNLTALFLFLFSAVSAQLGVESFEIRNNNESIQFLKVGGDTLSPKPTIIFCQGSLPIPPLIRFEDGRDMISALSNFDYKKISETYNIVVIAPPFIPISASESELNNQFAYVTNKADEHSYPKEYLNTNLLEKYVERGHSVIAYLLSTKWVAKDRIILIGHSQGAKVAAKIAAENKHVSALAFLSGNPFGRVDEFVRKSRLKALKGLISHEEAQQEIDKTYAWWKWQIDHLGEPSQRGEDSPMTIASFSTPVMNDLSLMKGPVYVAYGTEDITAALCDLLPLEFIRVGKSNYKVVPYQGLEHNYMEVDEMGNRIVEKCHWNTVMRNFIDWLEEIE